MIQVILHPKLLQENSKFSIHDRFSWIRLKEQDDNFFTVEGSTLLRENVCINTPTYIYIGGCQLHLTWYSLHPEQHGNSNQPSWSSQWTLWDQIPFDLWNILVYRKLRVLCHCFQDLDLGFVFKVFWWHHCWLTLKSKQNKKHLKKPVRRFLKHWHSTHGINNPFRRKTPQN